MNEKRFIGYYSYAIEQISDTHVLLILSYACPNFHRIEVEHFHGINCYGDACTAARNQNRLAFEEGFTCRTD